ncbi:MAG: DEAD/DEAH box helicase, partial [Methanobrevibacter sp.]|nr:DEAD/DEAH box helicase [Methanobrevibacter sp.]
MESFLNSQDIEFHFTRICKHCTIEGNITIINSKFAYSYGGQDICRNCAEEYISRELASRGFSKKLLPNFKRLLDKYGNLEEVMALTDPKFDPLEHPELTLFDEIQSDGNVKIPEIAISRLKIPKELKEVLDKENDKYLLPVQYLAIKKGLLKGEDLLVVSATGSGKTLVGELAGIPKAMLGEKFLFLTPLVALSNQKYRDFKKRYSSLGLKTSIKVGMNRIKAKNELHFKDSSIKNSDIVVGTYEGIDFLLRTGKHHELDGLGTVLIDEIHMLDDEERGIRLNGLIKRISHLFPQAQIIGLSATIKNQQQLSDEFNLKLVRYSQRPVPLERHITFLRNEIEKRHLIRDLVLKEGSIKSNKGYYGQTIIFTNSRRKTHQIADYLEKKRIKVAAYHGGLSYYKKEKIEKDFAKGK